MTTAPLLRRSILSRVAASSQSIQQIQRSSFLACHPPPNSSRFYSSSPDYATYDTSWQDPQNLQQQQYFNGGGNVNNNSNSHAVIKNLAGQEFAHLDNSHHDFVNNNNPLEGPRTSVLMELPDRVGALHDVLKYYWKYNVNITRIESRPVNNNNNNIGHPKFDFFIDFHGKIGDPNVNALLKSLQQLTTKLLVLDEKEVHWFPRHISELDLIANRTLDAGTDLEADHPGFHDEEYRGRRAKLAELAVNHRTLNECIPRTEYTVEEVETWGLVWDTMDGLWEKYACKEYKTSVNLLKKHCNYNRNTIPQIGEISSFLQLQTNFRLRPVAGLISSRDFLNGLAFRTFFCTQYIRHPSMPLYTPEPDICHELLGHVPMFVDRDFCDFSQEIGLASLGASDEDVLKLARCYWHSVEFGLCRGEDGTHKAYGAGLLSSFGELEYSCKERSQDEPYGTGEDGMPLRPVIKPWDPAVAAAQDFPITTYQPVYFLAESLQDAKLKMRKYCEDLPRPFFALYNAQTETVHIDRPVRRARGIPGDAE